MYTQFLPTRICEYVYEKCHLRRIGLYSARVSLLKKLSQSECTSWKICPKKAVPFLIQLTLSLNHLRLAMWILFCHFGPTQGHHMPHPFVSFFNTDVRISFDLPLPLLNWPFSTMMSHVHLQCYNVETKGIYVYVLLELLKNLIP